MTFNKWIDTFIEEKGIDLEESFDLTDDKGQFHVMPYGVVIEHMKIATKQEQIQIRDVIVKIDFHNGDVRHFFRHLAKMLVNNYQ